MKPGTCITRTKTTASTSGTPTRIARTRRRSSPTSRATDFSGDREGIAIYAGRGGVGYLVATEQLPVNSGYHLYRREGTQGLPGEHAAVRVFSGGADSTDGIEVTSRDLGPEFPGGLFVAMNSRGKNFLFHRWSDIQTAIGGKSPTQK